MHANFRDDGFTDKGIKFILSSLADVDFPALTFLDLAGSFCIVNRESVADTYFLLCLLQPTTSLMSRLDN